jgi:hydroxymethylglutaryl-CoA lyase
MYSASIELVEVGPRDGLQAVAPFVPTDLKVRLISDLYGAGLRRIEVASFVNPSAVPQMADAAEVVAAANLLSGLDASVLVPTARQAERAVKAGANHLVFVLSASEAHNRSNVRRSTAESAEEYSQLVSTLPGGTKLRVNVATAFDCPMTGRVENEAVFTLLDKIIPRAPWAEVALCDTTGRASPAQVSHLFAEAAQRFSDVAKWAFHGHDTYGLGTANVLAAWQAGVKVIDASCAGLGGCPFAPGATGNVATEDVLWMMDRMDVSTGVDIQKLCEVAKAFVNLPGAQTGGRVRQALAARSAHQEGLT